MNNENEGVSESGDVRGREGYNGTIVRVVAEIIGELTI